MSFIFVCQIARTFPATPAVLLSRYSDAGGAICFCALVFVVVAVVVALLITQRLRVVGEYARLAARYRGSHDAGPWFSKPMVRFTHAGSLVIVDTCSTRAPNRAQYTQVHFYGQRPLLTCEVYRSGRRSGARRPTDMEDVEIGSDEFDRRYIIAGDDRAALRELLSPPIQHQIEQLRKLLGNDNIYVSLNMQEMLVKKLSFMAKYDALVRYTELAIELYDQLMLKAVRGIEFVDATSPAEETDILCQICGDTIVNEAVYCCRCRTPHHQDCWEYYGACSTYGCGATRFVRPKRRRRP